ncbi:MAG: ribulose-phosphate 3-epimerase [Acidobacteriota bacterium]
MQPETPRPPVNTMKLAPSILASDLADLAGAARLCERGSADVIHFDVMDGRFVPNLTFGIPVLAAMSKRTELPIDVHLMVEEPERLLDGYLEAGAAWVSVHYEATRHLDRILGRIREAGRLAGVALNPATPVEVLVDSLHAADFVCLMSVNPGFGGQSFLPRALDKARRLRRLIEDQGAQTLIEMDGGIAQDNIHRVVEAGVDVCVTGSAAFGRPDPALAMEDLRRRALGNLAPKGARKSAPPGARKSAPPGARK